MTKKPSARRAKWAADHPLLLGLLSGSVTALAGIFLFDQSPQLAVILSALFGIGVWIGWRPGGWLRRIEERNHNLDAD